MPDDIGTETTRSDAPSANESPFADAVEDTVVETAGEQDAAGETAQDKQVPADDDGPDAGEDAEQDAQGSDDAGDRGDTEAQTDASDELKVVVSIKGGRAVIGVQQPSSDPHIETFDDADLPALAQEVIGVTERARARWEESPKHPTYERPAPPARPRRNRRQQGAAQGATTETQEAENQQQTLRLF